MPSIAATLWFDTRVSLLLEGLESKTGMKKVLLKCVDPVLRVRVDLGADLSGWLRGRLRVAGSQGRDTNAGRC